MKALELTPLSIEDRDNNFVWIMTLTPVPGFDMYVLKEQLKVFERTFGRRTDANTDPE